MAGRPSSRGLTKEQARWRSRLVHVLGTLAHPTDQLTARAVQQIQIAVQHLERAVEMIEDSGERVVRDRMDPPREPALRESPDPLEDIRRQIEERLRGGQS